MYVVNYHFLLSLPRMQIASVMNFGLCNLWKRLIFKRDIAANRRVIRMLIILDIRALPVVCNVGYLAAPQRFCNLVRARFLFNQTNSIMRHSFRYYFYNLPHYWIITASGCLFLLIIVIIQFSLIKSQEKQIMDLNRKLIHIQSCHEIMQSVERIESWDNERRALEKELERDRRDSNR